MKTGTIDELPNHLPNVLASNLQQVTKYATITNSLYDIFNPMINDQTWDSLSSNQQQLVQDAAKAAIKYNDTNRIDEEKTLAAFFKSQGLDVYSPDWAAFRKHVLDMYMNDPISKDWPPNIIQQLDSIPIPGQTN